MEQIVDRENYTNNKPSQIDEVRYQLMREININTYQIDIARWASR